MAIPKKVEQRIRQTVPKLRPLLELAKNRDVNEADTVTIVKKVLSDVLGWDPFFEVTSEHAIRGTYVDLAVRAQDHLLYLIEVKAIGGDLRDNHLRQAVNYAANSGVEWVVLTNGAIWRAHRVIFAKPIDCELVFTIDFLNDSPRDPEFLRRCFLLAKEGMTKSAIAQFHAERQAMSRFNVSAILRDEPVLALIRRELKRAYPGLNPSPEQIRQILEAEVLKRDVVEGEKAAEAVKALKQRTRKAARIQAKMGVPALVLPEAVEVPE
jgi:hypothetical protein